MSLPPWPVTVARMQTPNSEPAAVSNLRRSLIATFFGLAVGAKRTSVLLARICLTAGSGCGAGSGGRGSGAPMMEEHAERSAPQHSSVPTCFSMVREAFDSSSSPQLRSISEAVVHTSPEHMTSQRRAGRDDRAGARRQFETLAIRYA